MHTAPLMTGLEISVGQTPSGATEEPTDLPSTGTGLHGNSSLPHQRRSSSFSASAHQRSQQVSPSRGGSREPSGEERGDITPERLASAKKFRCSHSLIVGSIGVELFCFVSPSITYFRDRISCNRTDFNLSKCEWPETASPPPCIYLTSAGSQV